MKIKTLKNISKETQLVEGKEIKAGATFETAHHETLLRNYRSIFEEVKEDVKVESEEKPAKKSSKK